MAKIEPIVGRYIWVPFEGEEYRIYYEEAGEGIPLVCLHTAGTDGREWRHQLCSADINKNFRVIALDLPRHGKSIPPYDWYKENEEYKLTADFYSGLLMAFCQELELDKPVLGILLMLGFCVFAPLGDSLAKLVLLPGRPRRLQRRFVFLQR